MCYQGYRVRPLLSLLQAFFQRQDSQVWHCRLCSHTRSSLDDTSDPSSCSQGYSRTSCCIHTSLTRLKYSSSYHTCQRSQGSCCTWRWKVRSPSLLRLQEDHSSNWSCFESCLYLWMSFLKDSRIGCLETQHLSFLRYQGHSGRLELWVFLAHRCYIAWGTFRTLKALNSKCLASIVWFHSLRLGIFD